MITKTTKCMTTASVFSMLCPARTFSRLLWVSQKSVKKGLAAKSSRSIRYPRQDTREIPGPASNDVGLRISQLSFATCRRQIEGTCIGNQVLDAIRSSQCESRIAWPADVLLTMEETAVRPHCCLLCFGVFSVRDGPRLFRGSGGLNTWSVCSKQGCSQHMQLRLGYTHHPKYTRPQPFLVP